MDMYNFLQKLLEIIIDKIKEKKATQKSNES